MGSDTTMRDRVHRLAESDPARALELARCINGPWFRCQALSFVAEQVTDDRLRHGLLNEAFDDAASIGEPNRIVTVSTWPLRVLWAARERREAEPHALRLLEVIAGEPHPVRRLDALEALLLTVWDVSADAWRQVFGHYRRTAQVAHGWRRDRSLQTVAVRLHSDRPDEALELANIIERPRVRRQTFRKIEVRSDTSD